MFFVVKKGEKEKQIDDKVKTWFAFYVHITENILYIHVISKNNLNQSIPDNMLHLLRDGNRIHFDFPPRYIYCIGNLILK